MDISTLQNTNDTKMKMLSMFLFGLIAGCVFMAILHPKHEIKTIKEPIAVELSLGGEVRVIKADSETSIHVIADDNMVLTDVQFLPHNTIPIQPISIPKKHGQPTSQTLSSSSP